MVEVPREREDYSRYLPKNLSYEGATHNVPCFPSRRHNLKMDPACEEVNIDSDAKPSASADGCSSDILEDMRGRSHSLQSSTSTEYSEDYTLMSDNGENGGRTPPISVSSDEFSENMSLSTLDGASFDDDEDLSGAFSAKVSLESGPGTSRGRALSRDAGRALKLFINQDSLDLVSPTSDDELSLVTLSNFGNRVDDGGFHEDGEFDFLKTERVRRSTSLKTYKTPPGTPHRKKAVRFADALGLDLESVRTILNRDAPPKIPASATRDLHVESSDDQRREPGSKYLSALFPQPGARVDFMQRVTTNKVCLENCLVDDKHMCVQGTVRVSNIAYHKQVIVRYTTTRWTTQSDIAATYVANSNDGVSDRFTFTITFPWNFTTGSRLDFCILYKAGGLEYWDSNGGNNYTVVCYAQQVPADTGPDTSWTHFL